MDQVITLQKVRSVLVSSKDEDDIASLSMRERSLTRGWRSFILILLLSAGVFTSGGTANAQDYGERDFSRIPGYELFGQSGAFFFVHMYTDLTYWDYQSDHMLPLQFHSAQEDSHQFANYFTALFVGSEISETITLHSQIHFHLNPIPGQIGPTVVMPQAKIIWTPFGSNNVRFHMGRFYSPFGIANDDVQTPLNRFVSQPYSGFTAIPFHWFDTGVQMDLAAGLTSSIGANLAVAYTNGPQRIAPDVPPNFQELDDRVIFPPSAPGGALMKSSFGDMGHNVAVHLGLFPGLPNFEIGGSYTQGELRDEPLLIPDDDGPGIPSASRTLTGQYPADWHAVGFDLQYYIGRFSLRGDWTRSTEEIEGHNAAGAVAPYDEIEREAWRAQVAIHVLKNMGSPIHNAWLTFRVDERDPDRDVDDSSDQRRYTFGLNWAPHDQLLFKGNYELVREVNGEDLDNDGILVQAVAYF